MIMKRAEGRCEGVVRGVRCNSTASKLECHHKTYERFKCERLTDLEMLCVLCHKKADGARERREQAKSCHRVYCAGFDTFMTKKYGEEWETTTDCRTDEYDEWLDSKDDDDEA